MKISWSNLWKSSKQRRKQRKYRSNAPLHVQSKFMSVMLSKELRKTHGIKNLPVRKGDKVKIMVGQHKGFEGVVERVQIKDSRVYLEKLRLNKKDGSEVPVSINVTNLMITSLNLDDKKRIKKTSKKS